MDKSTLSVLAIMAIAAVISIVCDTPQVEYDIQPLQSWIGALVGAIGSIAGGIGSAMAANKQAKLAQQQQARAEAQLKSWYNSEMNTNILDRADTLSMLKRYRDAMEEQGEKYQTNAIKGGASEEAKIAYAQAANRGYADAISQIAAQGQQRKDRVSDVYMQGMMDIYNQKANAHLESGKQMGNSIMGAVGGLSNVLSSIEWGKK